jgi:hypothetical protein
VRSESRFLVAFLAARVLCVQHFFAPSSCSYDSIFPFRAVCAGQVLSLSNSPGFGLGRRCEPGSSSFSFLHHPGSCFSLRSRELLACRSTPSRFLLWSCGQGSVSFSRCEQRAPVRSYFSCRQLLISMPKILSCSRCQFLISLHPPMILHSQWWTFSFPLIGPGARPGSVRRLRQEANLRLLVILTW